MDRKLLDNYPFLSHFINKLMPEYILHYFRCIQFHIYCTCIELFIYFCPHRDAPPTGITMHNSRFVFTAVYFCQHNNNQKCLFCWNYRQMKAIY